MLEDEDWDFVRWVALRDKGGEAAAPDGWEPDEDEDDFEEVGLDV